MAALIDQQDSSS